MGLATVAVAAMGSSALAESTGGEYYGPIHAGPNKHAERTHTKHYLDLVDRDPGPIEREVSVAASELPNGTNGNNGYENGENGAINGAAWVIANGDFNPIKVKNNQSHGGPWVKHLKGPNFNGLPNGRPFNQDNGSDWENGDWYNNSADQKNGEPNGGYNGGGNNGHQPDDYREGDGIYIGDEPTFNGDWAVNGGEDHVTAGVLEYLEVGQGDVWRQWSEKILTEGVHWGGVKAAVLNGEGDPIAVGNSGGNGGYEGDGISVTREDSKLTFHFDKALEKGDQLVLLKQLKLGATTTNGNGSGGAGRLIGDGVVAKVAQYPNAVPSPTAIGGGLVLLGGLALRRRQRRVA
jgi:hypothetical protein